MSGSIQAPCSADAEVPSFVRRCRYRNSMSTAASEKMRATVRWTTAIQGDLAALLEVTHRVVSYNPWPGPVVVRAGWTVPCEYWPAMGVVSDTGRMTYIDVVHPQDEAERADIGFDNALRGALSERGISLMTVRRNDVPTDRAVQVGKKVRSYTGWSMPDRGGVAKLMQLVGRDVGGILFARLAVGADDACQTLVATACLLVMRRVLRLAAHHDGFAASILTVPDHGWGR